MHEFSLMNGLLQKIESVAKENNSNRVTKVEVELGALAHISADHFRDHFLEGIKGTVAQGAELIVRENTDEKDPNAQEIILKTIDVQ